MNIYLDTNVIVPYFWREATTSSIITFLNDSTLIVHVSTFTGGEFVATMARLRRSNALGPEAAAENIVLFDEWLADGVVEIDTDAEAIAAAAVLVRRFDLGLRMPDAIHAATCLHYELTLVTFDTKLVRAARTLGVDVIVPA